MSSSEKEKAPQEIEVSMRMGILHTVAKSIYSSQDGKFREAIANAYDNGATRVLVYADQASMSISIFDNGTGISRDRCNQIFGSLGVGLDKNNPTKLSYFGLGLMSVLQLGKSAVIYSKPEAGEPINLKVDVQKIFDVSNEEKNIEFLSECLQPRQFGDREAYSALSDKKIEDIYGAFPDHFTEIIIDGLTVAEFKHITSVDFREELQKTLPLEYEKEEVFLKNISDVNAKAKIEGILNSDFCPTIEVFFGDDDQIKIQKLYKYFPKFKSELFFKESNVVVHETDSFAMYMIFATEGLEDEGKPTSETGFWVRNSNFLVKRADFLSQPGKRVKLLSAPTRNWVFGEIFHKDMNNFLVASRDDYNWESADFLNFQQSIIDITARFDKELRKVWDASNKIVKSVIDPFLNIDSAKGPFERAYSTLASFGAITEAKDAEEMLQRIEKHHGDDLHAAQRIDEIFKDNIDELVLADDTDGSGTVIIDKGLVERNSTFEKAFDLETGRVKIVVSPDLFRPRKVTFLGRSFNVLFVAGTDVNQAININLEAEEIRVNPFNQEMLKFSVSFLDVYVAIEVAYANANGSVDVMKDYLYTLLGRNYKDTSRYFGSLGDDLRRFGRSRR